MDISTPTPMGLLVDPTGPYFKSGNISDPTSESSVKFSNASPWTNHSTCTWTSSRVTCELETLTDCRYHQSKQNERKQKKLELPGLLDLAHVCPADDPFRFSACFFWTFQKKISSPKKLKQIFKKLKQIIQKLNDSPTKTNIFLKKVLNILPKILLKFLSVFLLN